MSVLRSNLDESINWVTDAEVGFWEARYVSRPSHDIVYLSSQSGCKFGCQFCYLTATRQTKYVNATQSQIIKQASPIINHINQVSSKDLVHFNFMARGEPLDNFSVNSELFLKLSSFTPRFSKFLISTIMPKSVDFEVLKSRFSGLQPEIYYSLYSMDRNFRKRWLPGAGDPDKALDTLKEWQLLTNKIPKLHYAFISGENDSEETVMGIVQALEDRNLTCNMNVVRYNPPDENSQESPEATIERACEILRSTPCIPRVDVVPRVGYDVNASCGMFVQ